MSTNKEYTDKSASIEKIWARASGYRVIKQLGKFYGYWHLVIASEECGDIKLLNTSKQTKIIACDIDPKARLRAARYPNVVMSPEHDIYDATRWAIEKGYRLGSINVDLCFGFINGLPILKPILEIATCPVIFTYCRREGKNGPELLGYRMPSTPEHVQRCREKFLIRTLGIKPILHECYESDSEGEPGSHMAVCVFNTPKDKPRMSAVKKYRCSSCGDVSENYHPSSRSFRNHLVKCLGKFVFKT